MTADEVKKILGLVPHPREGGFFVETYRSGAVLSASVYRESAEAFDFNGPRSLGSAIYYLLETGTFSEMHRLRSDEVFHHYAGAAVEMLQLGPFDRRGRLVLGRDFAAGQRPQVLVPHGVWQGSRLLPEQATEGAWALLGCTVTPGFDYADYETGTRVELTRSYPEDRELIAALTRGGVH